MYHDKKFTIFTFFVLSIGIYGSYILSDLIKNIHYDSLESSYRKDAEIITILATNRFNNLLRGTTLSLVLSENTVTKDQFEKFSYFDATTNNIIAIGTIERITKDLVPEVEKDLSHIYNDTIFIYPEEGLESGDILWVVYYSNPYNNTEPFGYDVGSVPFLFVLLENIVLTKQLSHVSIPFIADTLDAGLIIFQPIMGIYGEVSVLTTTLRYPVLLFDIVESFINKFPNYELEIIIENILVYDSNNKTNIYLDENSLKFNICEDVLIIIPPFNRKNQVFSSIVVMISVSTIVILISILMICLNHFRIDALKNSKFKSRFISNLSHESKTPMNGIMGSSQLLLEQNLPEESSYHVHTIQSCGNTLTRMIDDVIDLSRIYSGSIEINNNFINISQMINNICENTWVSYNSNISNKKEKLVFKVYVDKNVPIFIKMDNKRLGQIISNLVTNSLKFTEIGEIKVSVYVNEYFLNIDVSDTGSGIDKKRIPTLFTMFTDSITDTGIGLFLVNRLCTEMNGIIKCESNLGEGTVFKMKFGLDKSDCLNFQENHFYNEYKNTDSNITQSHGSYNYKDIHDVLIVDDLKVNRMVLTKLLKNMGYKTQSSEDGLDAYQKCKLKKFCLIFMDISMPIMDGVESLKNIRNDSLNIDTPVVFITANVCLPNSRPRKLFPEVELLYKPIQKQKIESVLNKHVQTEDFEDIICTRI